MRQIKLTRRAEVRARKRYNKLRREARHFFPAWSAVRPKYNTNALYHFFAGRRAVTRGIR